MTDTVSLVVDIEISPEGKLMLPEGFKTHGDLDLSGLPIEALPNNLTIGGGLDLSGTALTTLPENLLVTGYLDISCTKITALPDTIVVNGDLYPHEGVDLVIPPAAKVYGFIIAKGQAERDLELLRDT